MLACSSAGRYGKGGMAVARPKGERYEPDPEDGLLRELVGPWANEKHDRLRRYVDITHATRRKYHISGSSYIDLYCGPGRARVRETLAVLDGSALVAAKEAASKGAPFSHLAIADASEENLGACKSRMEAHGFTVSAEHGAAVDTVAAVAKRLHPEGLHLAFLDPYSIGALPFFVIQTLARLKRMDLLIHFSIMDLQRNVRAAITSGAMDLFAPGWQRRVDVNARNDLLVTGVFQHWRSLIEGLGYKVSDNVERVSGENNQPLYWLVLASKHDLADKFWRQVSRVGPQRSFF